MRFRTHHLSFLDCYTPQIATHSCISNLGWLKKMVKTGLRDTNLLAEGTATFAEDHHFVIVDVVLNHLLEIIMPWYWSHFGRWGGRYLRRPLNFADLTTNSGNKVNELVRPTFTTAFSYCCNSGQKALFQKIFKPSSHLILLVLR